MLRICFRAGSKLERLFLYCINRVSLGLCKQKGGKSRTGVWAYRRIGDGRASRIHRRQNRRAESLGTAAATDPVIFWPILPESSTEGWPQPETAVATIAASVSPIRPHAGTPSRRYAVTPSRRHASTGFFHLFACTVPVKPY